MAARRMKTFKSVLEDFVKVHGDTYDYSLVEYTGTKNKVKIRCKKHDHIFEQTVGNHRSGQGCPICRFEKSGSASRFTTEMFIEKARVVHGDRYDYTKSNYVTSRTKLIVTCNIHGDFEIEGTMHLQGQGCGCCMSQNRAESQRTTLPDFIARAREVHGDKYDYSEVVYRTARLHVDIICNKHNTIFPQVPDAHLRGNGCPICKNEKMAEERSATKEHFIAKSVAVHGDVYDYSKVSYKNAKTKVIITCKEHGDFLSIPDNHWSGTGCPACCATLGFRSSDPSTLYVMVCGDITKVGITNGIPAKRAKQISKSYGDTFEVLREFSFCANSGCSEVETILVRNLRKLYKQPTDKFDGYTECFLSVDRPSLYNMIDRVISEYER